MSLLCVRIWRRLVGSWMDLRGRQGEQRIQAVQPARPMQMEVDVYEHVQLLRIRGGL